ncbi:Hypothetical protein MVR_LOCUS101 [uncultured virus]|nr:Hypothetical protein MVR_LOCUS101 [uncultured virus]
MVLIQARIHLSRLSSLPTVRIDHLEANKDMGVIDLNVGDPNIGDLNTDDLNTDDLSTRLPRTLKGLPTAARSKPSTSPLDRSEMTSVMTVTRDMTTTMLRTMTNHVIALLITLDLMSLWRIEGLGPQPT